MQSLSDSSGVMGATYPALAPKVDADGNDIANDRGLIPAQNAISHAKSADFRYK